MFIKIYCGNNQKYLLLQSNNVTLDRKQHYVLSDVYPIMCKYIEKISVPECERDFKKITTLCNAFLDIMETSYKKANDSEHEDLSLETFIKNMFLYEQPELIIPVLSEKEEYFTSLWEINDGVFSSSDTSYEEKKLSSVKVDEKTYITSGSIFVMNDDGKTIDRV